MKRITKKVIAVVAGLALALGVLLGNGQSSANQAASSQIPAVTVADGTTVPGPGHG